ncbi:MAG: type II toxin-antitoxin system VapC family toxin [Nitrospira sp. SB0677_bin_15]|nr:type II toxin-antitoxin system VapC family toxin [Nitrospira sp. SB0677_bin_15]
MILLDTHVVLWLRGGEARLGPRARREIDRAWQLGQVGVSAISFWEIAMLKDRGRIKFSEDVGLWRREQLEQGMIEIAVDGAIGIRAISLADFHADPADRLIVATALDGHRLVTADERILSWAGRLSRLRATE